MPSKVTVQSRAQALVDLFNEGKAAYNPEHLTAQVVGVEDGSGDYCIEVRESDGGDLVEVFSDILEFTNWIQDEESGYVD